MMLQMDETIVTKLITPAGQVLRQYVRMYVYFE
jgi:hypothetical protein